MKLFRLAFREEGEFVNTYMAKTDSMQNAILLASLRRKMLDYPGMFDDYKLLMQKWVVAAIADAGAEVAEFVEEAAPEHERSGKA